MPLENLEPTWNSLPANIRQCNSLPTFKRHLKTHLFTHSQAPLYPHRTLWRYTNAVLLLLLLLLLSIQTRLVVLCCIKRLCIFGPKGAIQIRYYYYDHCSHLHVYTSRCCSLLGLFMDCLCVCLFLALVCRLLFKCYTFNCLILTVSCANLQTLTLTPSATGSTT